MPEPAPEIDFRADGTVSLALPSGRMTLRRPTIGELQGLEEGLATANDAVRDAAIFVRELPVQPERRSAESDEEFRGRVAAYQQERDDARRYANEFKEESRRRYVGWFREVAGTLGQGASLPDDDYALPPWASAVTLGARLIDHWNTVPLPVATR